MPTRKRPFAGLRVRIRAALFSEFEFEQHCSVSGSRARKQRWRPPEAMCERCFGVDRKRLRALLWVAVMLTVL